MRLRRKIAAGAVTALVGALALTLTFGATRAFAAEEKAAAAPAEQATARVAMSQMSILMQPSMLAEDGCLKFKSAKKEPDYSGS